MAEGSGDHRVFDAVTMRPDTEGVSEAVWPQPLTPGLVFSHQLLPVGQPPQDVPEGLPAHCLRECELIPGLHQIKGGAVDGYSLKPPRFGLFFHATAGGEGLALDAAQAGAAVWGDALLIKRFITQCSRTDSEATRAAYRFEIKEFCRWRQRNHPHLHLREINPAFCQDWVDELRREVEAERMKLGPLTAGSLPSALCTDGRQSHAVHQ